MTARVGVVVFPGSNCEQDVVRALSSMGAEAMLVWHGDDELPSVDAVVLPGGFAHGDYLRTGALARFSPVMTAVAKHAASGRPVLGICNGFQILCEARMLPGALVKNAGLKFLCKWLDVRVENADSPFTTRAHEGQSLRLPINHFEGSYQCDSAELESLRASGQILLTYADNPNGSMGSIAGVANEDFTVFGLMPHPERACEALLGSTDGRVIFGSLLDHVLEARSAVA